MKMAKDLNTENELINLSKTVANLSKENPFSLPSSYFEAFPLKLLQKIENEVLTPEDSAISTALQALKNQNPYQVPPHYFDHFSVNTPKQPGKIINLPFRKWSAYAAAACLAGLIFGIVLVKNKNVSSSLASKNISKDVMENYLNETESLAITDKEQEAISLEDNTLVDVSPSSIAEMLKDVPDKDISRFMDLNGIEEMSKIN